MPVQIFSHFEIFWTCLTFVLEGVDDLLDLVYGEVLSNLIRIPMRKTNLNIFDSLNFIKVMLAHFEVVVIFFEDVFAARKG